MSSIDVEAARPLVRTAVAVRRFLEPRWLEYREAKGHLDGEAPSAATCLITTKFLQRVFADQGVESDCMYGNAEKGRGYFNGIGLSNHGWLRISGFDLDCTGDQFGLKPVSIRLADSDPCYQPANGTYDLDTEIDQPFLERWHREWQTAQLAAILPARPTETPSYAR